MTRNLLMAALIGAMLAREAGESAVQRIPMGKTGAPNRGYVGQPVKANRPKSQYPTSTPK